MSGVRIPSGSPQENPAVHRIAGFFIAPETETGGAETFLSRDGERFFVVQKEKQKAWYNNFGGVAKFFVSAFKAPKQI